MESNRELQFIIEDHARAWVSRLERNPKVEKLDFGSRKHARACYSKLERGCNKTGKSISRSSFVERRSWAILKGFEYCFQGTFCHSSTLIPGRTLEALEVKSKGSRSVTEVEEIWVHPVFALPLLSMDFFSITALSITPFVSIFIMN